MRQAVVAAALALLLGPAVSAGSPGNLRVAEDLNPAHDVLEVELTARIERLDLTGNGLFANVYTYNGLTPGPELRAGVGDTVIVHFRNELPEPMTVHWHGIDTDNANDGTTVTQNPVPTGGEFTYRFRVTRPGTFWYHPHAMPTNLEFRGLFGPIIVEDPAAGPLVAAGVLPPPAQTYTLMLADTTVCKAPGKNDAQTFAPGADVPWAFTKTHGSFPGLVEWPSPKDLCESPRDPYGEPLKTGPLDAGEIPNIKPAVNCGSGGRSCRVNEGQLVLTNGRVATARKGTPESPGDLADGAEVIDAAAGSGVRLRLVNAAVSRYFRLLMTDKDGKMLPLYRVGGQGGLLDAVRIEGGELSTLDLKYRRGEVVLGPGERADVVVALPRAADEGDVLTLWTLDFQHYGTLKYPNGYAPVPTVPVAHFRITDKRDQAFRIAAGDPLRRHVLVGAPVESLREMPAEGRFLDPARFDPPLPGSANPELLFTVVGQRESIDGIHGIALGGGEGDYREIPHIPSSRFARVGDLLEISVRNGTQMHHPLHLHGFPFQVVRLEDAEDEIVHVYDYNEFIDTFDIPAMHRLVVRVRLDDRPVFGGAQSGGALGRWLLHCHIFSHAAIGQLTELVVVEH